MIPLTLVLSIVSFAIMFLALSYKLKLIGENEIKLAKSFFPFSDISIFVGSKTARFIIAPALLAAFIAVFNIGCIGNLRNYG